MVERAFTDTGPTLDQELHDTLPVRLTDALPHVASAVAFTGWLLARRGYSARGLSRMFTLTAEQSRMITTQARSSPPDSN